MEMKTRTQVKEAEIVNDNVIDLTEKKPMEGGELKVINENGVINLNNLSDEDKERFKDLRTSADTIIGKLA